jgi:adenosine deaminase CECR1
MKTNREMKGSLAQNSVRWANFENQDEKTWLHEIAVGANGTGIKGKKNSGVE